ncbi:MAG: hypothetical protein ACREOO_25160 [bacterium]
MEIQLSEKAAESVKEKVALGLCANPDEFISDIVLRYEFYYRKKLEALNKEIGIGLEQSRRGESKEIDFDEFMRELDEELGYTT